MQVTHQVRVNHVARIQYFQFSLNGEIKTWYTRWWVKITDNNEKFTKLKLVTTVATPRHYSDSNRLVPETLTDKGTDWESGRILKKSF